MRGLSYELIPIKTILPVKATATTNGSAVDMAGFEGALMVAEIGQSGDTLSSSVYMTVKFQDSDDGTTFADISDSLLTGGANSVVIDSASEDETVIARGYIGSKRYLRVAVNFTGTHTNGTPISAVVVKGLPRHAG